MKKIMSFILLISYQSLVGIPYDDAIIETLAHEHGEYEALENLREQDSRDSQVFIPTKSPIVVSLGWNCGCAIHLERQKLSEIFFPFDWIRTPFSALCALLKDDLKGFIALENLEIIGTWKKHHIVLNKKYGIEILHDFKLEGGDPLYDYVTVQDKYERRIGRLKQVLKNKNRVVFFRTMSTKQEAVLLRDLIKKLYPQLPFTLVVINDTEDFKKRWDLPQIYNFFMENPRGAPANNIYYNAIFDAIFKQLKLIKG